MSNVIKGGKKYLQSTWESRRDARDAKTPTLSEPTTNTKESSCLRFPALFHLDLNSRNPAKMTKRTRSM